MLRINLSFKIWQVLFIFIIQINIFSNDISIYVLSSFYVYVANFKLQSS